MRERPILRGEVNFPLCLAPMVGLTHVGFRLLLKSYMPPGARTIWPTEMLNSRRLPHEVFARVPECSRHPSETDLVPQILGNDESEIARSVKRLDEEWGASGIDINMGCPVRKALSHNYGVALMGDAQYARDVVAMTVRHTRLPVSVKLRAADAGTDVLFRFDEGLVEAGAEWLTLHPRRAEQKRRGSADWSMIHDLRHVVPVAVIGNGDIQQADDVFRMLDETGCDAVMAGRALTARPWLLWQVGERLGWPAPVGREGERAPETREEEGQEFGRAVLKLSIREVKQFLRQLMTADAGRAKAASGGGDSVYWNKGSGLRKGKAYAKGPQLRKLLDQRKLDISEDLLDLADRLARLELTIGSRWFRRLEEQGAHWWDLTTDDLRKQHEQYFGRFIGKQEVTDMGSLLEELEKVAPTPGQALSAHRNWAMIRALGYELARESMARRTWYLHIKYLRLAGLSDADIGAGNVLPFRRREICIASPVRSLG